MPRVMGVDIPKEKRIDVALAYLYGVGRNLSGRILTEARVDPAIRAKDLTEDQLTRINSVISQGFKVEGDLKREISSNVKRLIDIGSYRGTRHRRGLPVRGQRTHTNSRTRKGPRRIVGVRKKPASAPAGGAAKTA
ncbi:MAG: 30S ribosomal protein S13 [Candidatus Omnitrophica bacterium]|nr:30S ribosomal protein S13 [Candidatus Omnitrophota bacterium]